LGAGSASALIKAGAACVTVIEDREGDIYESFALKPAGVEMLVRAAQDRALAGGGRLFAKASSWAEAGRMSVNLPAVPGRKRLRTAPWPVAAGCSPRPVAGPKPAA